MVATRRAVLRPLLPMKPSPCTVWAPLRCLRTPVTLLIRWGVREERAEEKRRRGRRGVVRNSGLGNLHVWSLLLCCAIKGCTLRCSDHASTHFCICYVMGWAAMLCCAMLCYALSCHVSLRVGAVWRVTARFRDGALAVGH